MSKFLSNPNMGPGIVISGVSIYSNDATQKLELGARLAMGDRVFHYAGVASAGNLLAGNFVQAAALGGATTTLQSATLVAAATAAGAKLVTLTGITTAQTADLYAGGIAGIWDASDDSVYTLRVKTHTALTTVAGACTMEFYDEIPIALTTSDRVALQVNLYKNIIVVPTTTNTGVVLGVPVIGLTASQFGFIQTWGPCGVECNDGNVTAGTRVAPATSTAGNALDEGTSGILGPMGVSTATWLDETAGIIYLRCAP